MLFLQIRRVIPHCLMLLAALALPRISRGAEPPALSAFTAEPELRMIKISPDGKTLAVVTQRDFVDVASTIDLATMVGTPRATASEARVANLWWKGSDRIVFLMTNDWTGSFQLVDLKSSKKPIQGIIDRIFSVVNPLQNDPGHMLVTDSMGHLKKFDILTGQSEIYEKHQDNTFGWVTDRNGRAVAAQGFLSEDWFMLTRAADGKSWERTGLGRENRPSFWPLAVHSDQRRLVGWDNVSANTSQVVVRDPATGRDERLFHSDEVDPTYAVYWGEDTTRLRGIAFETDRPHISYIDPADAAVAKQIDTALPDTVNEITSTSADESKMIIRAYSRSFPDAYYLFDRNARRISPLGRTRPQLDPKQLGASRFLRFPARDGLPLTAMLLLPPSEKTPPPLIVYVDSDFTTRISSQFQPYLQLLASRGYAVLQVNHRGVDGFGQKHALAGNGEVDGKMCDDLADGVAYAAHQGLVDGKRVAVWGEDLGGILGLFTLARHPDLFAAWINLATPITTRYWRPESFVFGRHENSGRSLPYRLESQAKADIRKLDPAERLKEIKVPSFLYYWDAIEASRIEKTLRKNGAPVILLTPPTQLSRPANYAGGWKQASEDREHRLAEVLKFLATYLPADPARPVADTVAKQP